MDPEEMNRQLIIIDKDLAYLASLCDVADENGLVAHDFTRCKDALEHIKKSGQMPLAYFLSTDIDRAEEFVKHLQSLGIRENIYFFSEVFSRTDEELLGRTGARYLLRSEVEQGIENLVGRQL